MTPRMVTPESCHVLQTALFGTFGVASFPGSLWCSSLVPGVPPPSPLKSTRVFTAAAIHPLWAGRGQTLRR